MPWHPKLSLEAREAALLAAYAMPSGASRGRLQPESPHAYRGPFQRDRDRIIHSSAYRRLSGKTQVFTGEPGDYHRTRLTHTIEVSSIARTIGRALRLNEDLIEALALLHDIGHPPFGHAGEDTLDEALAGDGGFDHNRHALRIVEHLEYRYSGFAGLNLSVEVLEGQAFRAGKDASRERPLAEVQTVDAADSIAYDAHDADDALELELLRLDELAEVPLWREAMQRVRTRFADLDESELRRAVVHELIDFRVDDLLAQTTARIERFGVDSPAAVCRADWIVAAGAEASAHKVELEKFLYERVYRHPRVMDVRRDAQDKLAEMFAAYAATPELLPDSFRRRGEEVGLRRSIGDYLAGMTDRFALVQHERLAKRP
ncbi:MAG: dNTP triphosphohydrolase [Pirellulales bacterium]